MDSARRFPSLFAAARTILGGDLLRLKSPRIATRSLRQYAASRTHPEKDPELLGAEALLEVSRRCGFSSEFYFMGLERGEEDFRYDASAPAVRAFSRKAREAGMVCGFHASRYFDATQTPYFSIHKTYTENPLLRAAITRKLR